MDKRQIEKTVNEYIGHAEEIGEGIDTCMRRKAFMDGAKWRINSVWHDLPNDLPQKENTWILLELILEGQLVYLPVEWVNDGEGAPSQATRWAYIDDLLPERKEGAK